MRKQKKVIIGFDIGIASVGWCITNYDTLEIVKHGVRTFTTVDSAKDSKLLNEERRTSRSIRRQVNRKKTLKRDFIKYLITSKFITDIELDKKNEFVQKFREKYINNSEWRKELDKNSSELGGIFNLREKGLTKKLNKKELVNVLYWYINHRGFKYEIIDSATEKKKLIGNLKKNLIDFEDVQNQIKKKEFPIKTQIGYFKKNGYLNGALNSLFHKNDYKKEIKQIFSNIDYLSKEFIEDFFEFFERQKSFEEGPGNKKTVSEYGIWGYGENNNIEKKYETVWEKTIGKCSVYKDENRAPKMCLSSELFNLLNDLNNLSIFRNGISKKLTTLQKKEIIKISFKYKTNINKVKNYIKKEFELDDESSINGFRIKLKGDKKIITELKSYHLINSVFLKEFKNFEYTFEDIFENDKYQNKNLINELSNIFSNTKSKEKRLKYIEKNEFINSFNFTKDEINHLSLTAGFLSGTHQHSYKALDQIIQIMIEEQKNSMQVLTDLNKSNYLEKYELKSNNFLSYNWIKDLIITPTVKRSLHQTVKVFNTLIKLCKDEDFKIKSIVIEMARESNNKDKRDEIKSYQKFNESINEQINTYIENKNNPSNILKNKIWLWIQQKNIDVYTGDEISEYEILEKSHNFEIDHIIPYNQCFDNSRNNKVLTRKIINQEKRDRTPFQFLDKKLFENLVKKWKVWYLDSPNKTFYSEKKFNNLITKNDFSIPENQVGFLGRNLVDTRYATKEFLGVIQKFKKINKLDFDIKTVNGKMTSFARVLNKKELINPILEKYSEKYKKEKINLKKDRVWYGHHAQDAYFITVLSKWYKKHKIIEKHFSTFFYKKIDPLNEENSKKEEFKNYVQKKQFDNNFKELKESILNSSKELNKNLENMLFSRRIERKTNIKLFNETLYKGINIENENKIQQIVFKKLENLEKKDCKKYFDINSKDSNKVIIKNKNKKMYKELCDVYQNYSEEKNPFKKAMDEENKKFILCNIKNKLIPVKKIQILGAIKNKNEICIINDEKNSFFESFSWIKIFIYKDNKNKFKLIPINSLNARFIVKWSKELNKQITEIKIIKEKLMEQKKYLNIPFENKIIDILYKGDVFLDEKEDQLYYIVGQSWKDCRLELTTLNFNFKKLNKNKRFLITLSSLKDFFKIKTDIIGNIIKKVQIFR